MKQIYLSFVYTLLSFSSISELGTKRQALNGFEEGILEEDISS
jgi:hypothetical protein